MGRTLRVLCWQKTSFQQTWYMAKRRLIFYNQKIMADQLQNFSQLLKVLSQNNLFEKAISQACRKYKIKHYRIQRLKPSGIKSLLKKNSKKQKTLVLEENNYAWAEGQLKIFVWLLVGYVFIKKIHILDMNQLDFQFFTQIFEGYSVDFLIYQSRFLLRTSEKVVWSQRQAELLNQIIRQKFQEKNWNTVAYQLYVISEKTVFRTPKQCRERWLNHEDPAKNHSHWNDQQDLELLRFIKSMGKRWSAISKQMQSTRTEHMVKNRYASLIKKASKQSGSASENQLLENLLKPKKQPSCPPKFMIAEYRIFPADLINDTDSVSLELQEFDNQQFQDECKKQNQKDLEHLFPYNLIMDLEEKRKVQQNPIELIENIDFFQKDNVYPTQNFLDFFF